MGYFNPSLKRLRALPTDKDVDVYRRRLETLGKVLNRISTVGVWACFGCFVLLGWRAFTGSLSWLPPGILDPVTAVAIIVFMLPYKYLQGPHVRNVARLVPLTGSEAHDVESLLSADRRLMDYLPKGLRDLVACEREWLMRTSTFEPPAPIPTAELKSVEVLVSGKPVAWFVDPRQAKKWALDNHSGDWMLRPRATPPLPEGRNA